MCLPQLGLPEPPSAQGHRLSGGGVPSSLAIDPLVSDPLVSGEEIHRGSPFWSFAAVEDKTWLTWRGTDLPLHDQVTDNNLSYPSYTLNQLDNPVSLLLALDGAAQVDRTLSGPNANG